MRKATDEQLLESYARMKSVWVTADEFGMVGQSVHERLQKLGATRPMNIFTDVERDRLESEYWIAAEAGKLAELAADMGRTKQFLCRQAKALGLTKRDRKKPYGAVWKYVDEEHARAVFEQFKQSSLNLGQFCIKRKYDDLGFARCMKKHFADEWEHVIEAKQTKQTMYRYGRQFEYIVRDHLKGLGYFALRSPQSRSPVDILAVRPGAVLFIQCKRNGALGVKEWNELFDLCASTGTIPLLAAHKGGRGSTSYHRLTGRKDGSGSRQPFEIFDPAAGRSETGAQG